MVERVQPQVIRAPTLHRLGIQAFQPILVEAAPSSPPLVCTAYNADFDGDQMAVHVPLSMEAQAEARFLMLAAGNILKPSDGKPVSVPSQDMILGSYWLTMIRPGALGEGKVYRDMDEAVMAYETKQLHLQAEIEVRMTREVNGELKQKRIKTTAGKIIFNQSIPQDLGFVDREDPETMFDLEVNFKITKKNLGNIIDKCYLKYGPVTTSTILDNIKAKGFHYSTQAALTVAISDMVVPEAKYKLLEDTNQVINKIETLQAGTD